MDTFAQRIVRRFQRKRDTLLSPFADVLIHLHLSANSITIISLLSGLAAVYFLFHNYLLLVIFGFLHLLTDSLDGVVARRTKTSALGTYLDHICNDGLLVILLMFKIGWYLHDYAGYLSGFLYGLALLVYAATRLQAPMLFTRTITLIGVMLFIPLFPWTKHLLTLNYLITGVAALWTLALQLQWKLEKK